MSKKWRIAPALVIMMLLAVLISACGGATTNNNNGDPTTTGEGSLPECVSGDIAFDGSSAFYPLAETVANHYQDKCGEAIITPAQSGSSSGLAKAQQGTVDIGNSDVYADPDQHPDLVDHQVAIIPFSIVVGSEVTGVDSLTLQQITDIYTGRITNWSEVGGPDAAITRIIREEGSGTRLTFQTYVMQNGETELEDAATVVGDGSGDVAELLNTTPAAIGYISTAYATDNNLKQVSIDGANATVEDISTNAYPFWGIAHMYTKGEATGLAQAFIEYMASDAPEVATAREDGGFIAISAMEQSALDAKAPGA